MFHQGDRAEHLFNVLSGCLSVYKLLPDGRRQIVGFLFPGDFLGLSVLDDYAYTAEAVTDTRLCRFQHGRLRAFMARYPKLEHSLLSRARDELAVAQEQMLLLGRKTAKEKLVTFLVKLSRLAEERGEISNPLYLPITRSDIADFLGLTTETVSRTFSELRKAGLIVLHPGNTVELLDLEQLEEIAEGY